MLPFSLFKMSKMKIIASVLILENAIKEIAVRFIKCHLNG